EWRRSKWSPPFKAYYLASSFLLARVCRTLVSDSLAIQAFYRAYFRKQTVFIPYGAPRAPTVSEKEEREVLERFGLRAGKYFLQITRVEPDNLPLEIARAFVASRLGHGDMELVSIGYKDVTP